MRNVIYDENVFTAKWIDVRDAIPKDSQNVLVCLVDGRRVKFSNHNNEMKTTIRIDKMVYGYGKPFWSKGNSTSVIAWMPMPEAPKVMYERPNSK